MIEDKTEDVLKTVLALMDQGRWRVKLPEDGGKQIVPADLSDLDRYVDPAAAVDGDAPE